MKVVKCSNATDPHFFDGDKYQVCPHCGSAPMGDGKDNKSVKKPGIFSKSIKSVSQTPDTPQKTDSKGGKTFGIFDKISSPEPPTVGLLPEELNVEPAPVYDPLATSAQPSSDKDKTVALPAYMPEVPTDIPVTTPPYFIFTPPEETIPPLFPDQIESIPETKKDDSGKTQGFFADLSAPVSGAAVSGPAISQAVAVSKSEPFPVGWLVCIKGVHMGHTFNIYAGKNSIGRADSNRICLSGDNSVSREKHIWVMYEPKKREFYVLPGEGSGLTYVNDEIVMSNVKISQYDRIEIGGGVYMLIPLCCENFTWEDFMEAK